ncbi:RidA family protein [Deinococcus sp.]|uniref:RidA family protein n=1 Tax=Deinococcus sp. TaxID=47478 RepID=UPI003C7B6F7A
MTQSPSVRFLHPGGLASSPSYTHAVEVRGGRTVYISGQIALNAQGQLVGLGDFEAQARQVFGNLALALASAGMTFSHVVKLGLYVTDMAHLATIRRVRDEFIDVGRPPASTLVQVVALATPDLMFEAEAIAVAPD